MIGLRFHAYDTVDSTNAITIEMAKRGEPAGTVVMATAQSEGRGRLGRRWWDRPGESVLMSAVLAPVEIEKIGQISFVAGVAIAEFLNDEIGVPARLKWPNDVLIGGRKVCGILVECAGSVPVVGIGVNVNQTEFPDELADTATSLSIETGGSFDVRELSERIAERLFAACDEHSSLGFEEILRRWRRYMEGDGRQAEVLAQGETVRGVISGLGPDGALLVTDDGGREHSIVAAERVRIYKEET